MSAYFALTATEFVVIACDPEAEKQVFFDSPSIDSLLIFTLVLAKLDFCTKS